MNNVTFETYVYIFSAGGVIMNKVRERKVSTWHVVDEVVVIKDGDQVRPATMVAQRRYKEAVEELGRKLLEEAVR